MEATEIIQLYKQNKLNLETLPKEQLIEIIKLLDEIEERETTRKVDFYKPHTIQSNFHKSQKNERIFIGGNNTGKTTAGAIEGCYFALGTHPYRQIDIPNEGWVISVDFPTSKGVAEKKIKEYMPIDHIKKWWEGDRILELKNGSTIGFKSCDSGRTKFQGTRKRWLWFDEEPDKEVYEECMARQMANYPLDYWITMTPLQGLSFTHDELYEEWEHQSERGQTIEVFTASIDDNIYLSDLVKANIKKMFSGTADEAARLYGKYTSKSGLLYKIWDRNKHLCMPFYTHIRERWTIIRGIDPHPSIPIHILWMAVSPKNDLYIVKELICPEGMIIKDCAALIIKESLGMNIVYTLIDTSANAPEVTAGTTIADEFRKYGVPVRDADKDFDSGYNACVETLKGDEVIDKVTGENKIYYYFKVFDNCPEFIWEIEHAVWDEYMNPEKHDPKQQPRKKRIHLLDVWRYIMKSRPHYIYNKPSKDRRTHQPMTGY